MILDYCYYFHNDVFQNLSGKCHCSFYYNFNYSKMLNNFLFILEVYLEQELCLLCHIFIIVTKSELS